MLSSNSCCEPLVASDLLCLVKKLIGEYLGTYEYQNGFITPSICIGKPPDNLICQGLEVVLNLLPEVTDTTLTTTGILEKQKWKLTLFDRGKNNVLVPAINKLKSLACQHRYIYFPSTRDYAFPVVVFEFFIYQSI